MQVVRCALRLNNKIIEDYVPAKEARLNKRVTLNGLVYVIVGIFAKDVKNITKK